MVSGYVWQLPNRSQCGAKIVMLLLIWYAAVGGVLTNLSLMGLSPRMAPKAGVMLIGKHLDRASKAASSNRFRSSWSPLSCRDVTSGGPRMPPVLFRPKRKEI